METWDNTIAYGMSPFSLFDKLNGDGFPITLEEAKELFDKYCKEFKTGVDYLRNQGKIALKEGCLSNLNGRQRNWLIPDPRDLQKYPNGYYDRKYKGIIGGIQREGGNFMIQSVNADITKLAMTNIRKYIKRNKIRSSMMLQVYDEIVTCTHKDDSESFRAAKNQIMVEAAERWITSVPMTVDGCVHPYWTKE